MRYGMMIELDQCVGCQACVSACKERWDSGPGASRTRVPSFASGHLGEDLALTFFPSQCNHCDEHPCTIDCPTGATYADASGIVVVDPDACIGCGNCVDACPYGARTVDAAKGTLEKCTFCAPYVARGETPACVATCLANCRHFGDLDDPAGDLRARIAAREAEPLSTASLDVGARIYYAPAEQRLQVLAQGVVQRPRDTLMTRAWTSLNRPLARWATAPAIAMIGAAGLLINLRERRGDTHDEIPSPQDATMGPATLPRHRAGLRFLHWFNLASWLVLLTSGTYLFVAPRFALFGAAAPRWLAGAVGGHANLLWLHVAWGLLWSTITVPSFLLLKRGGIEALKELAPSLDDVRWLIAKPRVMLGLSDEPLPPQDKYNIGQKLFALSALAGTTLIIATGVVMAWHLGPPELVRAAILMHEMAVMLALVGIAVHITMAAIFVEERPALRSMLVGDIDAAHARRHNLKWVHEMERRQAPSTEVTP